MTHSSPTRREYFVDEAGDPTLFDRRGRVLVGTSGCSRFFMLGLLDVEDHAALSRDLSELRQRLLSDPYFKNVPSMQPSARKTAVAFHAKDDLPEVRREVFAALRRHKLRYFAAVRDKHTVVDYVRQRNAQDDQYRYQPNELYDYLVRRLFKTRLHKHDEYHICFARRGQSNRTTALEVALSATRNRFREQTGIDPASAVSLEATTPTQCPGIQAADYFTWALQRLYERQEERYLEYIWPFVRLVNDIDDTSEHMYGVYYTQKRPLTLDAIKKRPGI